MINDSYRELTGRAMSRHLSVNMADAAAELHRVSRASVAATTQEAAAAPVESAACCGVHPHLMSRTSSFARTSSQNPARRAGNESSNNVWHKSTDDGEAQKTWTTGTDDTLTSAEQLQKDRADAVHIKMISDSYREVTGSSMPRRCSTSIVSAQAELRRASSITLDVDDNGERVAGAAQQESQGNGEHMQDQSPLQCSWKVCVGARAGGSADAAKPLRCRCGGNSMMEVMPTVPQSPRVAGSEGGGQNSIQPPAPQLLGQARVAVAGGRGSRISRSSNWLSALGVADGEQVAGSPFCARRHLP